MNSRYMKPTRFHIHPNISHSMNEKVNERKPKIANSFDMKLKNINSSNENVIVNKKNLCFWFHIKNYRIDFF